MTGGHGRQQREFTPQGRDSDYLSESIGIDPRWFPTASAADQFERSRLGGQTRAPSDGANFE